MKDNVVIKPWGYYKDIERSKELVFKQIVVAPSHKLSLQYHNKRSEIWYIHSGYAKITIQNDIIKLTDGSSINIPVGYPHRVENLSKDFDLIIYEVQTGICEEDDIVRIEDDYGRETPKES
jgi:mannose-6-phosphate isomerase-like protein (cupin superfamily)